MTTLATATVRSPVGDIFVAVHDAKLCALVFADHQRAAVANLRRRYGRDVALRPARDPAGVVSRLRRYLAGELHALDDIPVETGGTDFQRAVWAALRRVPVGRTWSYEELARTVGAPRAVRAVGTANGQNPCSLVVPCHRVIRKGGHLGGYGGGLDRKRWLLVHEGALLV
jgi:methylated-DNA-[protein]-cysteine S-methyltransferase